MEVARCGASAPSAGRVERHRRSDEVFEGSLVYFVALANVDRSPGAGVQAGIEQT
jgi:hypothetical protein